MKRHMRMSLVLVTLLLTLGILLTGCGEVDELQAQIDDNATKADNAIKDVAADVDAADKAAKDAQDAADKAATDAAAGAAAAEKAAKDAAAKALEEAVTELEALVAAGDKADKDALADAIAAVNAAIDAAKAAALDGDADLQAAIAEAKDAVDASMEAFKTAWNDATDAIVVALAEIEEIKGNYLSVKANYDADKAAIIENALDVAWVKVVRALDAAAAEAAVEELKALVDITPTVTREIYNLLAKIIKGGVVCTPAEEDDKDDLARVKMLIYGDPIKNYEGILAGANDVLKAELHGYGEDNINLEALYLEYQALYNIACETLDGSVIKAEMDEINAQLMTPDTELTATWDKYQAWVGRPGNTTAQVEGFDLTVATYSANMQRVADLVVAKAEAEALNARIDAFAASVAADGGTKANYETMNALIADINEWVDVYFSGDYADEVGNDNYNMVKHDEFKAACDDYNASVAGAMAAATNFITAVKNIGDINLLKWDEIELAKEFYLAWLDEATIEDFGFMFNENEAPEDYLKTLTSYEYALNVLIEEATTEYEAAEAIAATVDATTITLYSNELNALNTWYTKYTAAGFENTTFKGVVGFTDAALEAFEDVEDGYKLSNGKVITAETYAEFTALQKVQADLIAAKNEETAALIKQIADLGFISVGATAADSSEDEVAAARDAYTTWKNGTSAQNAVKDNCTTFVVTNYNVLTAAEAKIVALKAAANEINTLIAGLEYVDAGMDLADLPANFDSADYAARVTAIKALIAAFEANDANGNDGNRGMISEDALADLAAAEIIVSKYNALVAMTDVYYAKIEEVELNAEFDAEEKTTIKGLLEVRFNNNKTLIEKAETVGDIENVLKMVEHEFDAIINGDIIA